VEPHAPSNNAAQQRARIGRTLAEPRALGNNPLVDTTRSWTQPARGRAISEFDPTALDPYGTRVPRRMVSTTVYLTPEQDRQLRLLHERTRVPVAEYVRQGIDMVLDRYADLLPGQLSFEDRLK
jgi:hypothetical protein